MERQKEEMPCHRCGVEMNHHADKVDYAAALTEPEAVDPDFGGVLVEVHTCPKCGHSASRRAS